MKFAIETVNLTKYFFSRKRLKRRVVKAVEDINLKVKKGELFALLGPNGAGKTTLLKLLSTLILPTKGTAYLNGYNLQEEEKVKESIGLVTGEERSFYWRLSGRENLYFFASLYNLKRARKRVEELVTLLEIEEIDRRVQEYSTGMKQRLALARSLLNDPPVLLMDEPTKSLDPLAAQNLRKLIKGRLSAKEGKAVLFTTHRLEEAESFSDRIGIMDKGQLKGYGTLEELRELVKIPGASLEKIFKKLVTENL
jgi:ABC-2 type transport system ATP-binding protein